jgi:ATP-dependent Clp protease ATP-binding subunit ClpA
MVEEPSVEATVDILFGLKDRLEKYHNVIIEDQTVYSAVKLSERFIQDRFLPDKAIDTLDEACALAGVCFARENAEYDKINIKVRQNGKRTNIFSPSNDNIRQLDLISQSKETFLNDIDSVASIERPRVTEDHVNKIIKEITGAGLPCDSRYTKEMLIERLSASVIGQEKAVEKVAEAIIRNLAGINQHNKPRGIFLFVGESGVGKTKLAQSISKELFGNEESMIKYDMSEYSESTAVTKLLGASPGYVGYDDQNTPIERVRKHPYSVILFDEIEKAHPDILSLFLQIFDEGLLTDSLGRKISFRNAYIVMTSNVGSRVLNSEKSSGFISSVDQDINFEKLRDYFRDEFINRIDEVVVFSPLRDSALKEIAKMRILDIQNRLNDLGIRIEADEEIYELLIKKATISRYGGAREIGRVMMSLIENKIAEMIVDGSIKNGDIVKIIKQNNDIKCIKQIYALNI